MPYVQPRNLFKLAKLSSLFLVTVAIMKMLDQRESELDESPPDLILVTLKSEKRRVEPRMTADLLDFEEQVKQDEELFVPGLGEGGEEASLPPEERLLGEEALRQYGINVPLSDRIAYNRTLTDFRHPACKRVVYDAELPSASVIIIFHNEPYSVVVRTVWSVVNSARRDRPWFRHANYVERGTSRTMALGYPGQDPTSPFVYLKEIILVDDNSTLPELKGKLSHYVRTRMPPDLIRILRLPDRLGVVGARMRGASSAYGDVLVFLDAHCETQPDWLRPLLQRVKDSPHSVALPIVDIINASTFYYSVMEDYYFQVGGFLFTGTFWWDDVPERELQRRGSDIAPTRSPTMTGGLFAIGRLYFWELGGYDEQMAGSGGEKLEISFRIWQCGGMIEILPCSRVGHIRTAFQEDTLRRTDLQTGVNIARVAEVWMDDYKELFYLNHHDLRKSPKIGDVTARRLLRKKLQCKSFQWYLDHVYPEKFVPVRDVYGYGRFKNNATGLCLDKLGSSAPHAPLGVSWCASGPAPAQLLFLDDHGRLRDEARCAEIVHKSGKMARAGQLIRRVVMEPCARAGTPQHKQQMWRYLPSQQLQHAASGLCACAGLLPERPLVAARCQLFSAAAPAQVWDIDRSRDNGFRADKAPPTEQEAVLLRLRERWRPTDTPAYAHLPEAYNYSEGEFWGGL